MLHHQRSTGHVDVVKTNEISNSRQVIAKRLLHYIASGLLSPTELDKHIEAVLEDNKSDENYSVIQVYHG